MALPAFDRSYPTLLLWSLTLVVAIALVIAASTTGAAFGTYNPAWDGASDLRSVADDAGVDHDVALNASEYERVPTDGTMAVVLSPERGYDRRDRGRLADFVRGGGTLLVAEDYGSHGNELLAAVGASARFDGRPVRDERYNYRSPAMPAARNVTDHRFTRGVSRLTINHGTVVEPNDASVLVRTSEFAYLDDDGDGELDGGESLRGRPVVTVERVGEGRVVAVSDPSLFVNAMLDRPGNARFARNLFAAHERALFDYSHAGRQPPLTVAVLTLRGSAPLRALGGLLGIGAIAIWARRSDPEPDAERGARSGGDADERTGSRDGASVDEHALLGYARERHPDWDESRLRRVMQGVFTRPRQEENDE